MWKKLLLIIPILSMSAFAQNFESRIFGGIALPIGAEIGFVGETDLPKTAIIKMFTRGSIIWAPVLGNKESTNSVLIGGLQPGLRLKLLSDIILISGGFSVNPIVPLPFDGMDFGLGTFLSLGIRINNFEIGLYGTKVFGKEVFISEIGWFSLTISKSFPVFQNDRKMNKSQIKNEERTQER